MIKETLQSFPVPTLANPAAVYDVVDVRAVRDEAVDNDPRSTLALAKAQLAQGRNLNHAAVVEEHARLSDKEAAKKAFKIADGKRDKDARLAELEALGVPGDHSYLMDTAAYAKRSMGDVAAAPVDVDEDVRAYEKSLKRVLESKKTGANRLMEHLEARQEYQAKRARASGKGGSDTLHISSANAEYNRQVQRSLRGDKKSQALKQALERGTA